MSFIVLFPPEQAFDQVRWDAELIEDFRLLFNLARFDKVGRRVPVFFLVQLPWFQLLKGYETVKVDPKPVCMSIFAWNTGSVCRNQIVHIFDCRDESIEVFLISQNFSQCRYDHRIDIVSHSLIIQVIFSGIVSGFLVSVIVWHKNNVKRYRIKNR